MINGKQNLNEILIFSIVLTEKKNQGLFKAKY